MLIETQRLRLRPVEAADAARFTELCSDDAIARNTARVPRPYTREDAERFADFATKAFAAGKEFPFAVCRDGALIACAGVEPLGDGAGEIGYWVGADARGQGVATEAASAVVAFAFDRLGMTRLDAGRFADNPASGRVLEKVGFEPTGETFKLFSLGRGEEADTIRYRLDRPAFRRAASIRLASG